MDMAILAEEFYCVNPSVTLTMLGTVLGLLPLVRSRWFPGRAQRLPLLISGGIDISFTATASVAQYVALSLAINRDQIKESVFLGLGEARQGVLALAGAPGAVAGRESAHRGGVQVPATAGHDDAR